MINQNGIYPFCYGEISLGSSIKHDCENAWTCYKWINKGINVIYYFNMLIGRESIWIRLGDFVHALYSIIDIAGKLKAW